ncbi:uncharacterized protein LOC120345604 [Styela clava]
MPCFPAQLQAPVKSFLRPGTWMPGSKTLHTYTESWKVEGDPEQCIEEMMNVVGKLNETEHPSEYFVNKVRHQDYWMQIFAYTPAGWLDVVEISFLPFDSQTSLAKISSFSTGMLPAWVPFGFICDVILCWCPFSDQGMNEYRCQLLRDTLPLHVSVLHETEDKQLLPNHRKTDPKKYESTSAETQKNK